MNRRFPIVLGLAIALVVGGAACAPQPRTQPSLTFRLWDPNVAAAYHTSFASFEAETGIHVDIVVVPWEDYWTQLRADIASGTIDDVFWTNATNVAGYARAGAISAIPAEQVANQGEDWAPSVIEQFTVDGELWGVPQLTDPGIGILVNTDALGRSGLSVTDVQELAWDPRAADDSLRTVARALTVDAAGLHPDDPAFDPTRVAQYGYGASSDLNAILLPFLGSNGAAWQSGDAFVFASAAGIDAIRYVVELIDEERVAPPAADTLPPAGSDAVRELFLAEKLAMFQTGAYSLPYVEQFADFSWTIVPLPSGPTGRISPTNGIVAAASSATADAVAQDALLQWLGSTEGAAAIGESGSTLPAVQSAQAAYLEYWSRRGIDVTPLFEVLKNGWIQPPQGENYGAAADAMQPYFDEVFLGARPLQEGLEEAERAANDAMR